MATVAITADHDTIEAEIFVAAPPERVSVSSRAPWSAGNSSRARCITFRKAALRKPAPVRPSDSAIPDSPETRKPPGSR